MNYRALNGVRTFQVALAECGLYLGVIDGVWGGGCQRAADALFADHIAASKLNVKVPSITDRDHTAVISGLQTALQSFGLYSSKIDGIWGNGSINGLHALKTQYIERNKVPKLDLCWSTKVPAAFTRRVKEWCASKGLYPNAANDMMGCMAFESGYTFSPSKQNNGGSYYFGLIQFGKAAAADLGTTVPALIAMTQMQQLEYVFKYFEMWMKRGKKYTQLEDFYLTIFYPAAVGMKADQPLFVKFLDSAETKLNKNYVQNSGFDKNKDNVITIGEISNTLYEVYFNGMNPKNRSKI